MFKQLHEKLNIFILISSSLSVLHKKDVFSKKLALMKKLLKNGMGIVIEEISFAFASEIRAIQSRISQVMGIEKPFEGVFNNSLFWRHWHQHSIQI